MGENTNTPGNGIESVRWQPYRLPLEIPPRARGDVGVLAKAEERRPCVKPHHKHGLPPKKIQTETVQHDPRDAPDGRLRLPGRRMKERRKNTHGETDREDDEHALAPEPDEARIAGRPRLREECVQRGRHAHDDGEPRDVRSERRERACREVRCGQVPQGHDGRHDQAVFEDVGPVVGTVSVSDLSAGGVGANGGVVHT